MIRERNLKSLLRGVLAGGMAMLLTGCMLVPGKFVSELTLLRDGTFAYTYEGEIHLMSMSKLMKMGSSAERGEFTASTCYDDETFEEKECSAEELAQQRADFEQSRAERAQNEAREAEQMKQMFGGIDPSDPAFGEELARRIERQAGFDRVMHKGDGLFEVSFRVAGTMDYDFVFPTFERLPIGNFFLYTARRDDGSVRIDAPGFAAQGAANPMQAMMTGVNEGGGRNELPPGMPAPDGTFTIVTDGEILANNTDEGPSADPRGKRLTWAINRMTPSAPTALIRLN